MNNKIQNCLETDLNILKFVVLNNHLQTIEESKIIQLAKENIFNPSCNSSFFAPLSTRYKQHYKKIKSILEFVSQNSIKRISIICEILLKKTEFKTEENLIIRQKLEVIFITTKIFEKKRLINKRSEQGKLFLQGIKTPLVYHFNGDRALILNNISKIFEVAKERIWTKEKIGFSDIDLLIDSCFTVIGKRLISLKISDIIQYCEKKGESLEFLDLSYRLDLNLRDLNLILSYCSSLKKLNFSGNAISSLNAFKSLSQLEELNLGYCSISAKKLLRINKLFLNLTNLDLSESKISNFDGLEGLPLKTLNLKNCPISAKELLRINKLFLNLTNLNLSATEISNFDGLEGLPLEKLELMNLKIFEPQFEEEILLDYTSSTFKDFFRTKNLFDKLKKLNLSDNPISSLDGFKHLSQLEDLNLENCPISENELLRINKFSNLTNLNLSGTKFLNFDGLEGLPLKTLNLKDCPISENELLRISKVCPNLTNLNLSGTKFLNFDRLEDLSPLEELYLGYCENLSQKQISLIKKKHFRVYIFT